LQERKKEPLKLSYRQVSYLKRRKLLLQLLKIQVYIHFVVTKRKKKPCGLKISMIKSYEKYSLEITFFFSMYFHSLIVFVLNFITIDTMIPKNDRYQVIIFFRYLHCHVICSVIAAQLAKSRLLWLVKHESARFIINKHPGFLVDLLFSAISKFCFYWAEINQKLFTIAMQ